VSMPVTKPGPQTGAGLLVQSLEAQGVEYVFGIPGAKIDTVFDTLLDSTIKTVVCRHEQNAAFIAGGIGRMTGKAGVALVTSGPGCSNLVTGLATANSEGDPVVVGIPVDYRDNHRLMEMVHPSVLNRGTQHRRHVAATQTRPGCRIRSDGRSAPGANTEPTREGWG
jgi:thiamine pyrophosphate-dependent acetolactate synthase large subunit-like protein